MMFFKNNAKIMFFVIYIFFSMINKIEISQITFVQVSVVASSLCSCDARRAHVHTADDADYDSGHSEGHPRRGRPPRGPREARQQLLHRRQLGDLLCRHAPPVGFDHQGVKAPRRSFVSFLHPPGCCSV